MSMNTRGATSLWDNAAVNSADATANSNVGNIGAPTNVAIFIDNQSAVSMTFKVQAGGTVTRGAGINAGVTKWFDYQDVANTDQTFTVAAGDSVCFDFSPFAPNNLRLVATAGNAAGGITAFIISNG
jgi:hypothetical protein